MANIKVSFHNLDHSATAEELIRRRAEELDQVCDRISGCRVVVDLAHRHQRQGRIYQVRIELAVPGGPIVVSHDPGRQDAHGDVTIAIRDAFDAVRRRLQDHVRRQDGDVKQHDRSEQTDATLSPDA